VVAPSHDVLAGRSGLERRSSRRQHLRFPATLHDGVPAPHGKPLLDNAQTINISAGGVYVRSFSKLALEPGDVVHVRIVVPEPYLGHGGQNAAVSILWPHLDAPAEVVRVERVVALAIEGLGFALRFQRPLRFAAEPD
jgi:hypothetical protein